MRNEHTVVAPTSVVRGPGEPGPTGIDDSLASFCAMRVEEARRQFQRVLALWAQDVLVMRRAGRHRLKWECAVEADGLWGE